MRLQTVLTHVGYWGEGGRQAYAAAVLRADSAVDSDADKNPELSDWAVMSLLLFDAAIKNLHPLHAVTFAKYWLTKTLNTPDGTPCLAKNDMVVLVDSRYVTRTGLLGWYDLYSEKLVTSLPEPAAVSIGYDIAQLFRRFDRSLHASTVNASETNPH